MKTVFLVIFFLSLLAHADAPSTLISAGDASLASITSNGVLTASLKDLSIVITASGSPVGTLTIQVSDDPVIPSPGLANPASNVTNWASLSSPTAISAAGSTAVNLSDVGYRWFRVVYTKTSGTGTITVNFDGK